LKYMNIYYIYAGIYIWVLHNLVRVAVEIALARKDYEREQVFI